MLSVRRIHSFKSRPAYRIAPWASCNNSLNTQTKLEIAFKWKHVLTMGIYITQVQTWVVYRSGLEVSWGWKVICMKDHFTIESFHIFQFLQSNTFVDVSLKQVMRRCPAALHRQWVEGEFQNECHLWHLGQQQLVPCVISPSLRHCTWAVISSFGFASAVSND